MGKNEKLKNFQTEDSDNVVNQNESIEESDSDVESKSKDDFLQYFWQLADTNEDIRIEATRLILSYLKDASDNDDIQYTFKRLIRGLASSRDAARQGFSTTLSQFLVVYAAKFQTSEILNFIDSETVRSSSMKSMEQRELVFGRIFGYMAVHQSGILEQYGSILNDTENYIIVIIKGLIELSSWKNWIRELCYECILSLLNSLSWTVFIEVAIPMFLSEVFNGPANSYSPEAIGFAIGIERYAFAHFKTLKPSKNSSEIWKNVVKFLPDSILIVQPNSWNCNLEEVKKTSSCFPRIHSLWRNICGLTLQSNFGYFSSAISIGKLGDDDIDFFSQFWSNWVDNVLISGTHERRGIALKIFEMIISNTSSDSSLQNRLLKIMLSPGVVNCLIHNSTSKKNYLHNAATHLLKKFRSACPRAFFNFLQSQFASPDCANNSEVTNDTSKLSKLMKMEIEKDLEESKAKQIDRIRQWVIEEMFALASNLLKSSWDEDSAGSECDVLLTDILVFFLYHSYFFGAEDRTNNSILRKLTTKTLNDVSNSTRTCCVHRLFSLCGVDLALRSSKRNEKSFNIKPLLIHKLHILLNSLERESTLINPLNKTASKLKKAVMKKIKHIINITEGDGKENNQVELMKRVFAFGQMFLMLGLQLLDQTVVDETCVTLQDLIQCYDKLVCQEKSGTNKSEEDDPMSVLIDILLGLLSHDSSVLREVVKHLFRSICRDLNVNSLQQLVDVACVLDQGEDQIFDVTDDEFAPIETRVEEASNPEEKDDDYDNESEDDSSEDVVLKTADEVTSILNESDLQEREDAALASIVRQIKDKSSRKATEKQLQTHEMHFKLRVLELIELAHSLNPSSELSLYMISPMCQFLNKNARNMDSKFLYERIQAVLNKVFKSRSLPGRDQVLKYSKTLNDFIPQLIKFLIAKNNFQQSKQYKNTVSNCLFFVFRVLLKYDALDLSLLKASLSSACCDYFQVKNPGFPGIFFDEFIHRYPILSCKVLVEPLTSMLRIVSRTQVAECSSEDAKANGSTSKFSCVESYRLLTNLLRVSIRVDKDNSNDPIKEILLPLVHLMQDAFCELVVNDSIKSKRLKHVGMFGMALTKRCVDTNSKSFSPDLAIAFNAESFLIKLNTIQKEKSIPSSVRQLIEQAIALININLTALPKSSTVESKMQKKRKNELKVSKAKKRKQKKSSEK